MKNLHMRLAFSPRKYSRARFCLKETSCSSEPKKVRRIILLTHNISQLFKNFRCPLSVMITNEFLVIWNNEVTCKFVRLCTKLLDYWQAEPAWSDVGMNLLFYDSNKKLLLVPRLYVFPNDDLLLLACWWDTVVFIKPTTRLWPLLKQWLKWLNSFETYSPGWVLDQVKIRLGIYWFVLLSLKCHQIKEFEQKPDVLFFCVAIYRHWIHDLRTLLHIQ